MMDTVFLFSLSFSSSMVSSFFLLLRHVLLTLLRENLPLQLCVRHLFFFSFVVLLLLLLCSFCFLCLSLSLSLSRRYQCDSLPEFICQAMHGVTFNLIGHEQLSVRENATRAFAAFLSRCPPNQTIHAFSVRNSRLFCSIFFVSFCTVPLPSFDLIYFVIFFSFIFRFDDAFYFL